MFVTSLSIFVADTKIIFRYNCGNPFILFRYNCGNARKSHFSKLFTRFYVLVFDFNFPILIK